MNRRPLIFGTGKEFGAKQTDAFPLLSQAGFDGAFTYGYEERIGEFAQRLKELGMIYQSVHGEYFGLSSLWNPDSDACDRLMEKLLFTTEQCARYEVPIMVVHAVTDLDLCPAHPNQLGIERFGRIVRRAEELGVRVAFENTDSTEYVQTLLNTFPDERSVGFCWDSGHENAYTYPDDVLSRCGNRLIATHIHDNLGKQLTPDGKVDWRGDLHRLPFDGAIDWNGKVKKLIEIGFRGPLTFELLRTAVPGQDPTPYQDMPMKMYLALAYERADRLRRLVEKYETAPADKAAR